MKHFRKIIAGILSMILLTGSFSLLTFGASSASTSENVARGAKVIAAVQENGKSASNITDGNTSTYWDGGVVSTDAIVDLGGFYEIHEINVVNYFDGRRYYHYTLDASGDGVDFEPLAEKRDDSVATESGDTFEVYAIARYVRITITKNSANSSGHVNELRVYGDYLPDYVPEEKEIPETDVDDPDNIAYRKPTRANSNNNLAARAVDGNTATYWLGEDIPRYVDVDLEENYDVSMVQVFVPSKSSYRLAYAVYGSLDGISFEKIGESSLRGASAKGIVFKLDTPVCYRIIRVMCISSDNAPGRISLIGDIKVHGTKSATEVVPTRAKLEFKSYDEWLASACGVDTSRLAQTGGTYDIRDTYTEEDTIEAVRGIISRTIGSEYNHWFEFKIVSEDAKSDYYEIYSGNDGKIYIEANKGVCLATGLNYYLKYYCNVNVSQQTIQGKMPASAPEVAGHIMKSSPYEVRYSYNYCTLSYTMPFFGYDDWQRELDYLALNGVNLILDTTATEALWVMYLQQLGYSADEAKDFVCGYAYKAWWLMGNLEGYGGTVSDQWIYDTLEMARVNERFMTVLGIQPALQAFVGMFPNNFAEMAQGTLGEMGYSSDVADHLVDQGEWSGFHQPILMNNTYEGYDKLAEMFYATQKYLYGPVTDYYCGDLCHEGGNFPTGNTREGMSGKILELMIEANPDAVWILQVWWSNPTQETLRGFGDYREDHILLLDLTSAHDSGKHQDSYSYGGKEFMKTSWVYCILDCYGGRTSMHADLQKLIKTMTDAQKECSHMKGIGTTTEGSQQNPLVFELYWELGWETEAIDLDEWVKKYVTRRYGEDNECLQNAWNYFVRTAYAKDTGDGTGILSVMTNIPALNRGSDYSVKYDTEEFEYGVDYLLDCFADYADQETYVYDVVEVLRQMLTNTNYYYYTKVVEAFNAKNSQAFNLYKDKFMDTMWLIDEISSYQPDTMLGTWLGKADNWVDDPRTGVYDDYTLDMMRFNAATLITVWGSKSLSCYAGRQYAGLFRDFYIPMWQAYLDKAGQCLNAGTGLTGMPTTANFFSLAWNIVIGEEKYEREVSTAKGDRFSRGLEEIFAYILNNHTVATRDDELIDIKAKASYSVESGTIRGVKAGTTFKELEKSLIVPEGTRLECDVTGELSTGDRICLVDEKFGYTVETCVVYVQQTEEEKEVCNAVRGELNDFLTFCRENDLSGLSPEDTATVRAAIETAEKMTATSLPHSVADYQNASAEIAAARQLFATEKPAGKGCKSSVGGGVVYLLVTATLAGALVYKKKEK